MTGTAKALPTAFFRLLWLALVLASGSSRRVQSVGKPRRLSASVGLITRGFGFAPIAEAIDVLCAMV